MPDHLHAIVVIDDGAAVGLATVVGQFKAAVTRRAGRPGGEKTRLWQRGYFDHVVRNERDLDAVRWYIATNPARWTERYRP